MQRAISLAIILCILFSAPLRGQQLVVRQGTVKVASTTSLENIEGQSTGIRGMVNQRLKVMSLQIDMASFNFPYPLMQKHFQEQLVHVDSFPQASFTGRFSKVNWNDVKTDRESPVTLSGRMGFHGQMREMVVEGSLRRMQGNSLLAKARFPIRLSDYGVTVTPLLREAISETVWIEVEILLNRRNAN